MSVMTTRAAGSCWARSRFRRPSSAPSWKEDGWFVVSVKDDRKRNFGVE